MATIINPDNGEFIVKGTISSSSGTTAVSKLTLSNTDDIDLNNIPANFASADVSLNVAGGAYINGNQYVGGTFVANGDVITLGNSGGSLTLGSNISSDILPSTTTQFDIGSSSLSWKDVYARKYVSPHFIDCISATNSDYQNEMIQTGTQASITLPDGTDGMIKNFITISAPASPVTITPTNAAGYTSIRFTNVGDSAQLIYNVTGGWHILNVFRTSVI